MECVWEFILNPRFMGEWDLYGIIEFICYLLVIIGIYGMEQNIQENTAGSGNFE